MGKVSTHMTMSLDGYIADPDEQVGEHFDWYEAGETSVASANEDVTFDVDETSAKELRELTENSGALVSGRRTGRRGHPRRTCERRRAVAEDDLH